MPKKPVIKPRLPKPIPTPLSQAAHAWVHEAAPHNVVERRATSGDVAERFETSHDVAQRQATLQSVARAPRRAKKALVTFASGDVKQRMTVYLDDVTAEALALTCARDRYRTSEAIEEAVRDWLVKRGAK